MASTKLPTWLQALVLIGCFVLVILLGLFVVDWSRYTSQVWSDTKLYQVKP